MDAEEKLTALKKAYADVILNMSKEAASRVMASERRAVRYQHELKAAKEEGVRMLMRLKQMMDSKINEAKATSLNQQSKIEELEAQLQEAEDIVKDLREELVEAQSELERVKDVHLDDEPKDSCSREIPSEHRTYSYQPQDGYSVPSDVRMLNPSQGNECEKCFNKTVPYIGNRDLPSIILRGKDPGLYRNGCTQRIRACKRKLCDKLKGNKDEIEMEEGNNTWKSTVSEFEKKLLADVQLSNVQSFPKKRKRASRKRKNLMPLVKEVKDDKLIDKMALLGEASELAKSLDASDYDMASENLETNFSEATEVILSEPLKERVIKYTFQRRKLKGQALSGCEVNAPLEIEKEQGDEQNDVQKVERPKCSLLMESSRDSRRLAQVARQLLSLSEKKWD